MLYLCGVLVHLPSQLRASPILNPGELRDPRSAKTNVKSLQESLSKARHIALVRLGSIGDVIATIPLAWTLRAAAPPGTKISWLVHGAAADLVRGVDAVDTVTVVPKGSILSAIPEWKRVLRPLGIDTTIDVHGNLKSGVVCRLTGAERRVGFHRRDCREHWNPLFTNVKLPRMTARNKTGRAVEIARLLGIDSTPRFDLRFSADEQTRAADVLAATASSNGRPEPVAALQLGRSEDIRSWPVARYAELARKLLATGYRVLILGGPPERESGEALRKLLPDDEPRLVYEVGTLSLREVGALFTRLALEAQSGRGAVYVGGDSGCLHLSAATGLRTIGLFGPQDPDRTAPIGDHVDIVYHPEAASCIPCARRECLHPTPSFCMQSIGSPEVSALVREGRSASDDAGRETNDASLDDTAIQGSPCDATTVTPVADPNKTTPETRRSLGYLVGLQAILTASYASLPRWSTLAERHETATSLAHGEPSFPGITRVLAEISEPSRTTTGTAIAVAATLATLWLTGETARRLGSGTAGLVAAALLGASALFQITAASAASAMLFVAFITWSAALFLSSELGTSEQMRPGFRVTKLAGTGLGATLAALGAAATHGMLGIILPGIATIAFHAGEKALGKLLRPKTLALAGLALAVSALALVGRERGALDPFEQTEGSSRWLYLRWSALLGLPLSLLTPFALYAHLKNRAYREDLGFADRRWRYPKAAFLAGFGLLCLTPLPRLVYLAAVTPPLAILAGSWIDHRWTEFAGDSRSVRWTSAVARGFTFASLVACLALATTSGSVPAWIAFAVAAGSAVIARGQTAHSTAGLAFRLSTLAPLTALVLERLSA